MEKIENFLFYFGISLLILCIFLIFLFFGPKKINENENLVLIENLSLKQIQDLTLNLIEEGDLVLMKPKSFADSYQYEIKKEEKLKNPFKHFFLYNLFDKIIINSMGDTYWHTGIYMGNNTINSLSLDIHEDYLNENLFNHKYFKVLNVKTPKINKKIAIDRANKHLKNQDIFYSLKNGLLITFIESIGLNKEYKIKEDELVCSSYIASIYREINFDDKPFTHITPIDIEFSDKVETKFLVNETGFFIRK